ncbi:MAG: hypothetical protein NT094_00330 [Candidatus Staskawiczbacteria bacterium]|nr:hypothetical protein [Candidatus Staskawiczbacteria bacterium]
MREILDSRDELVQSEELPDQEVEISDVAGNKTEKKESVLMDRLMERSHKQALIAFQLEQLISKQGSSDPDVKKYLNTLPPEISEKFGQIIRDYSRQKKQTSFSKHWLLSDFEENEDKPITPEYLGKVIFEGQVGLIPKGKITFEQREAYFVMVCEDPDDYALIYKGRTVDSNRDKKAELSGGSFHNNMSVSFEGKGIDMPVLLANR